MKVKILEEPGVTEMKEGGLFNPYPWAGALSPNPFGAIKSDIETDDVNINDSLKPVEKEKANAEYEKGEAVLKFDMGGLYRVNGKKHSQGGTPVIADPGDFVFSDDKDLAFNKKDKELFDLTKSKSEKKKENTPAKILLKEVDPKHYNKMIAISKDYKSGDIAKTTATLMLEKYSDIIGKVAYIQEEKKNFPQGLPPVSEGTAPVETKEWNEAEDREKMYMQYGGTSFPGYYDPITGDYISMSGRRRIKATPYQFPQDTGQQQNTQQVVQNISSNQPTRQALLNVTKPTSQNPVYTDNGQLFGPNWTRIVGQYPDQLRLSPEAQAALPQDYPIPQHKRNTGMYGQQDWNTKDFRERHADFFKDRPNFDFKNPTDVKDFQTWYNRKAQQYYATPYFEGKGPKGVDSKFGEYTYNAPGLVSPQTVPIRNTPNTTPGAPPSTLPGGPNLNISGPSAPQNPNIPFTTLPNTPFEGFNVGMNALEAASVAMPFLTNFAQPTYYDMLQQRRTPDLRLDRLSNQQELSDIQQQSALATREAYSNLSPTQAQGYAGSVRANALRAEAASNAQLRNSNTQIANQEAQINYGAKRSDQDFNLANIRQTFTNNTRAKQYRNEQMANASTQSFNNLQAVQSNLDTLNQTLTAAVLPYLSNVGVTADGVIVDKNDPKAVRTVQVPPVALGRNRTPYATGFGNIMAVPGNGATQQFSQDVLEAAKNAINSGDLDGAAKLIYSIYRPNTKGESPAENLASILAQSFNRQFTP